MIQFPFKSGHIVVTANVTTVYQPGENILLYFYYMVIAN